MIKNNRRLLFEYAEFGEYNFLRGSRVLVPSLCCFLREFVLTPFVRVCTHVTRLGNVTYASRRSSSLVKRDRMRFATNTEEVTGRMRERIERVSVLPSRPDREKEREPQRG